MGKTVAGLLGNAWKKRYFVLIENQLRWYETATVDADGNASIKGKRKGQCAAAPSHAASSHSHAGALNQVQSGLLD